MTKAKGVFKKRKDVGKRKIIVVVSPSKPVSPPKVVSDPVVESRPSSSQPNSSSKKKLSDIEDGYREFLAEKDSCCDLVNLDEFTDHLFSFTCCKYCGQKLEFGIEWRVGLATKCRFSCQGCRLNEVFVTSKQFQASEQDGTVKASSYEVNIRLLYAFRAIGRGLGFAQTFCGLMNLPKPPSHAERYYNILGPVVKSVAKEIMHEAVAEAVKINDDSTDLAVALDGTWQKRGHVSLNGVVTLTSIDTGKVLDVSIMSKYCLCKRKFKNEHEDNCKANYVGSSGGMEVEGVKEMFRRSITQYGVRYKTYLGDGDSKAYDSVVIDKPYGDDCQIKKIECVGHVQKRMGTRLRNLKLKSGKKKLSDGKTLGGKNRLTNARIILIQRFYGLAVRRNKNNLAGMRRAIWATFCHLRSTNENPNHILCPDGQKSWCKYAKAKAEKNPYDHKKHFHLAPAVMDEMKPICKDLCNLELLRKCLHGNSQNPNESVNNVIWSRIPKNIFVSLNTLCLGVYDAISCFNKGNLTRCMVLKNSGSLWEEAVP